MLVNSSGYKKINERINIESIQILRGVAALSVVIHHAIKFIPYLNYKLENHGLMKVGNVAGSDIFEPLTAIGVDIFFVISGFIMFYVATPYISGQRPVADFMARRLARIVPLYYFVTLVLTGILLVGYLIKGEGPYPFSLTFDRMLTSFLFIPSFNEKGLIQPILGVGWTLIFEMAFYVCFALALYLFPRQLLVACGTFIVLVFFMSNLVMLLMEVADPISLFFSNNIILEFLFGCFVAHIFMAGKIPSASFMFRLILLGFGLIALGIGTEMHLHVRSLFFGVPAAVIVTVALTLEQKVVRLTLGKIMAHLGDISYSLYLVHIIVIYNFIGYLYPRLIKYSDLFGSAYVVVFLSVIGSVAAASMLYRYFEKPVLEISKKYLDRRFSRAREG